MTRVCVVGSVNADLTFTVDKLPLPGETVLASALASCPGGKGANQAVAAARAGAEVQFVGAVGTDPAADALLTHLTGNDVGTDGVITVPGPSGTAAIMVDANAENMIVVAPGANAHLVLDSAAMRNVVAEADVVLLQLEIPVPTAVAAARIGRAAGATVIISGSNSPTRATSTDANGLFAFDSVPYGAYAVTVLDDFTPGKLRSGFTLSVGGLVGNTLDVGNLVLDGIAPSVLSSNPPSGATKRCRSP